MNSEKTWNYLFYYSLVLIPTLSIFGRELQSVVSNNNFNDIAEYVIAAALIITSLLVVVVRPSGPFHWPLAILAMIVFLLVPYQLDRYEERLHFICFGVLGFSAYRSFGIKVAMMLTCLAGMGDEVLQYFLPSRVGDWRDVVMNCFAGLSAALLAHKAAK
jgi:VanZ family protein